MEDGGAEVGGGWLLRVFGGYGQVELPYACHERGVCRAGKENVELGQIVAVGAVEGEEVVGWERLAVEGAVVGSEAAKAA